MNRFACVQLKVFLFVAVIMLTTAIQTVAVAEPVSVGKEDKCPVCGMFVAKYPDFLAQIIFEDGSVAFFDGVKDLFKYYFDLHTYNPAKSVDDIASVYVSDYYSMELIDGKQAWFVLGSDVYGPMGRELIPFFQQTDAQEFLQDHGGTSIVRFGEVTSGLIGSLD